MAMEIRKKLGKTELSIMANDFNTSNYFKRIRQIQVFRKELPLILERIPLEQRIELLEKMNLRLRLSKWQSSLDSFKMHISQFGIQKRGNKL